MTTSSKTNTICNRFLPALVALFFLPLVNANASPEEDAVLAPINATFDGMSHRDAAAIKAAAIPNATLTYIRDGKPGQLTIEAFAARLSAPPTPNTPQPAIRETIHDPVIHIDQDLAVVWAPFDFTIDGKVDHCGTDLFNLMRVDGQWRITSITWNSRKDCPAH
ncbi:MAG TPA: nuclear transport factor 2 family protein [Acidobacteriaceae bacterium]